MWNAQDPMTVLHRGAAKRVTPKDCRLFGGM